MSTKAPVLPKGASRTKPDVPKHQMTFLDRLRGRELGRSASMRSMFTPAIEKRINKEFDHVLEDCDALTTTIKLGRKDNAAIVVGDILGHFLDHSVLQETSTPRTVKKACKKRQQRELFTAMGGAESLLKMFLPPFSPIDAEQITRGQMQERSEMYNEVLVIIRELLSSVPSIADQFIDTKHMIFMFTLLRHQSVFDNTMHILEEVLATREDTINLGLIPKFNSLVTKFTPRQLAHFCRVLSLVVFEPEDRSIMEGSHVLRSLELLQLRRNRMSRNCGGVVERNQNLILEMPNLFGRLVQILRVINFGPGLSDLVSHNIVTHMPITSEVLEFYCSKFGINEWDHFANLEFVVERQEHYDRQQRSASNGDPATAPPIVNIHEELLRSFSPTMSNGNRSIEFGNIANVMQLARSLGIADYTPLGHAVILAARSMTPVGGNGAGNDPFGLAAELLASSASNRPTRADLTLERLNPVRAKKELQFHSMLLTPHQIELVFVICTLLSGRRKLAVQKKLVELKFGEVLNVMYDRMSWDAPPFSGVNPMEHVHGPNCECNPEGAVRIQYLRLIHNFYDRDFLGNNNKYVVLSPDERRWILSPFADSVDDEESAAWQRWQEETSLNAIAIAFNVNSNNSQTPASGSNTATSLSTSTSRHHQQRQLAYPPQKQSPEHGLIVKIIHTLNQEKSDSTYRFWLSACLENFLRGSGRMGQYHLAKAGALLPTVKHIISGYNEESRNTLQTSFDLLGEIIKANKNIVEYMESQLSNDEFREFMMVVMDNLVESNVFLRSLFLTLEVISASNTSTATNGSETGTGIGTGRALESNGQQRLPTIQRYCADSFGFLHNAIVPEEDIYLGVSMMNHNEIQQKNFQYLNDSWIQFCPEPLNDHVVDLYDSKSGYFDDIQEKLLQTYLSKQQSINSSTVDDDRVSDSTMGRTSIATSMASRTSLQTTISSIGDGVMDAIQGIRKATTHFLRFGEGSVSNSSLSPTAASRGITGPTSDRDSESSDHDTDEEMPELTGSDDDDDDVDNEDDGDDKVEKRVRKRDKNRKISIENEHSKTSQRQTTNSQEQEQQENPDPEDIESDDVKYFTPRDSEVYGSSSSIQNPSSSSSSSTSSSLECRPFQPFYMDFQALTLVQCNQLTGLTLPLTSSTSTSRTNASNFAIPPSLFRFSIFILQEKMNILLRLMSIVSLRNINHENICCLNTALMILLFDYTRGNLALTLSRIKQLADQEYSNPSDTVRRGQRLYRHLRANVARDEIELEEGTQYMEEGQKVRCCPNCPSPSPATGRFRRGYGSVDTFCGSCSTTSTVIKSSDAVSSSNDDSSPPSLTPPSATTHTTTSSNERRNNRAGSQQNDSCKSSSGSAIVMRNFRELLWYWQEYYLRRGRDRLSIEFSCHIPFRFWFELVGVLCADDGSCTSLLPEPISLPRSPYTLSIPSYVQFNKHVDLGVVLNF